MAKYSMRIAWSEEDELFVATCPEFDDISALAPSYEEAVAELREAITLAVDTYKHEEWPLPKPQNAEVYSGQFRVRLPRSLHAWLVNQAQCEHVSLNTFVASRLSQARGQSEATIVSAPTMEPSKHIVGAVVFSGQGSVNYANALADPTPNPFRILLPESESKEVKSFQKQA